MNKAVSIIITLSLLVALFVVFTDNGSKKDNTGEAGSTQSVEVKNGIQYITIKASGGYYPNATIAKGGIPTKLIMKTNGAYDCSASLVIPSIGFQKILPQTGETEIEIGTPKVGVPLRGVCGMGMYNFVINFS